jgi:hypothetical protein
VNEVGVNLTQGHERPGSGLADGSQPAKKGGPILLDRGAGILRGEAEIQGLPAVDFGDTARPGAETMDKPGNRSERIALQDFGLRRQESFSRHREYLSNATTLCNK